MESNICYVWIVDTSQQRVAEFAMSQYHSFPALLNLPVGTVMPQIFPRAMNTSTLSSRVGHGGDLQQTTGSSTLQPPVVFWSARSRECGISLGDALSDRFLLVNPNEIVLNHGPTLATIQVQVSNIIIAEVFFFWMLIHDLSGAGLHLAEDTIDPETTILASDSQGSWALAATN
jgi:hypothetical protein